MNATVQTTYLNQLKRMISDTYKEESDVETVLGITYGVSLTGKYLDDYNQIMEQRR